ncbi:hypothetical protein [Desulfuribacillus alkaliarsenatis]|uniref:Uncharacterized protein n=1 Tax=Desulfuribacillus alkaliarsenatis TaxID=766136 RepID=A0A1E5G356_9FIRM|nr:hypothetical protein [Desulfuribacillus alkaliarsenatis]OEF97400.1 hypothetical protein BHF68_04110 [Desulfuribacillus alkaliarsenatis]
MGVRPGGCPCEAWADLLTINEDYRVNTEAGQAEPNAPLTFIGSTNNFLIFELPNNDTIWFCCEKITSIQEA